MTDRVNCSISVDDKFNMEINNVDHFNRNVTVNVMWVQYHGPSLSLYGEF